MPDTYAQLKFNPKSKSQIWCPLKGEYRTATPEEKVRQAYILRLHTHYGYALEQMDQERKTQHGRQSVRADILIWKSVDDKAANKTPVMVVECKSDNVKIVEEDYYQGESYARSVGCELFVTHNTKETRFFKLVPGAPGEWLDIEDIPRAADWSDAKKIETIKQATRAFNREEFRRLLFDCHSILRDVHKHEPGRAFDEISKILFIKMYIERTGDWGKFTTEYLDQREAARLPNEQPVMDRLFELTKEQYQADDLFTGNDKLTISESTFRRIVKKLERFNLSITSDDVKGIAFERFLGETFRGNLGQYFTPRPVVDFAIEVLDPQEGEVMCDPAAGSGGFLIRFFDYVRADIEHDIQQRKDQRRKEIEAQGLSEAQEVAAIDKAFTQLTRELDPQYPKGRLYRLAHECIFGTDAEARAARTSKMNMIMHGDGHGGIHYHDGFVDVNGIFPGRFDLVLTNPPFGSKVGDDQRVGSTDETRVTDDAKIVAAYRKRFGKDYTFSHERMLKAAKNKTPLLELYDMGKGRASLPSQILFLERCLQLLKPGGRMAIVLPDGILNNPDTDWVRRWAEGRARLLAVVSLPPETFRSAKATVKASLVFMQRFTVEDDQKWQAAWQQAHEELDPVYDRQRAVLRAEYGQRLECYDNPTLRGILDQLFDLHVERSGNTWIGVDALPEAKARSQAKKLCKRFTSSITNSDRQRRQQLQRELDQKIRETEKAQHAARWARVRELFDYPVFFAEPETVGITGTGADGPTELPEVVTQYRLFQQWVAAGAQPEQAPDF